MNITSDVLLPQGVLHSEPEYVLRRELHRPNTYFSLLRAIAQGNHAPGDIADAAGVQSGALSTYLGKLREMDIVYREQPAIDPETAQNRYRLTSPFFRFWFRFVHGRQGRVARLGEDAFNDEIGPELNEYTVPFFEELCHQALPALSERSYHSVGRWWSADEELGVVGVSDGGLVTGDCDFELSPTELKRLGELEQKVTAVPESVTPNDGDPRYALFSPSFTEDLRQVAQQRSDVDLYTCADVLEVLQ